MPGPIHTIKMQFPINYVNMVASQEGLVTSKQGQLWYKHSGMSEKGRKALDLVQTAEKYTARLDTKHDIRWQCNTKPKTIVIVETTIFKPTNTQNQKQTALSLCKVPGHRLYFRSNREAYLVVHVSSLYVLNLSKVFHSGRYKTKALGETLR